ncbi:hypothetical protein BJV78DRAFT_1285746 [Lactifluus subvellereus]|nr:hypothetical protein BJV78DRAFT_1285746 [Lactifluus subvellereus]
MSQGPHQAIPLGDISKERIETSGHRNVLQSTQNQMSQGQSNFSDGSGPLFNMYVKMAEEEDNKSADRWQKDADSILLFTGLFSASVAALVAVSIQDLRPGPQDNSEFYLENIYRLLADPNVSRASILAAPVKPPPFSPPKYAIWVNSLWFLSLAISLTCALLATLLQQWARRYLTVTQQPRHSPHKRARICAFLADGVNKLHLPWAVETLPTLLHCSLFLFFSGLLVFLFNIHHTVFSVVVCPYYAPLSSSTLMIYTGVSYGVFRILSLITDFYYFSDATRRRFGSLMGTYRKRLWWGVVKTAQETASVSSAEIDRRVLRRIFDSLDEDHELEQFFECIPGFCSSEVVDDPRQILAEIDDPGLTNALIRFWYQTWTSSFVSETVKKRRLTTCVKATDSACLSDAARTILEDIFGRGVDGVLRSVEIGHSLGSRGNNDEGSALCAQGIVAGIIASVPERDDHWIALALDQLGISEGVLRDYLAHGDSVLLANLIHFTRQFFRYHIGRGGRVFYPSWYIVQSISEVDIKNTLPGLQHDFCALWNEIVLEAEITGAYSIPVHILRYIRHIYIALHQGTDSAPTAFSASTRDHSSILYQLSSYPLCNIPGHGSNIHEAVVGPPEETVHASAATLSDVPHPDAVPSTLSSFAGPDGLPLSTLTPPRSRIRFADEPSLHDMLQATTIIESSHLTPPVNFENSQFPAISLESVTAAATQGPADTPIISPTPSSEFGLHSTPAASTSTAQLLRVVTPPSSSTVATQHNTDLGVVPPSIIPSMPFSSVSTPAPGHVLPADPRVAQVSPGSQIDQLTPGPGFLPLGSVTAAPQVTSVSHPNIAPNDAALDTHINSRVPNFSNNMEAPHHPHQLDMSVPDIATDLSRHSLDTAPSSRDTDRPGQRDIQP